MTAQALFLQALRDRLGESHVLAEGDLAAYETDWRKRYRGQALAIARPGCTEDVAAVVRLCASHGVSLVPQGGNTGLVGGGVPDANGRQLVLSLTRMRRILEVDADNLTLTAEAGCVLRDVQAAAEAHGLLYPLSLGSEGSCTVGGNLASNAGGVQVLRYGNARDLCLGLEVVTATGDVWKGLSGLRKDNSGYDLRDLFIGSEGTLGIITAATLELHPRPGARLAALVSCRDAEAAVALLRLARTRSDGGLTGFELMAHAALALVARYFPQLPQPLPGAAWTVLLEMTAPDAPEVQRCLRNILEPALDRGIAADAVVASTDAQSRALWQLRESIPLAQARDGLNAKHDISLPIGEIPGFLREMDAVLGTLVPGVRLVVFGHLGDGNLHYNVQAPAGMPGDAFLRQHETALNQRVHDAVCARNGSFAAEHGIGELKAAELSRRKCPVALAMMRAIKDALDPQGIMNPGRTLLRQSAS